MLVFEPSLFIFALISVCFLSALLHSSVGLGGGSSYVAWMLILGVAAPLIPIIALSLNVIVSGVALVQFLNKKLVPWSTLVYLLLFSVPAAYIGASLDISAQFIYVLLLCCLLVVFLRYVFFGNIAVANISFSFNAFASTLIVCALGIILGLISGMVGIGGGIYLVPALVAFNLLPIKQAIACGSAFIFFNSLSGLSAKVQTQAIQEISLSLMLVLGMVVFIGGAMGSYFSANKAAHKTIEKLLMCVIAIACMLLIKKLLEI